MISATDPDSSRETPSHDVTAIIVNYRTAPLAAECAKALIATTGLVVIVDNDSGDGSAEFLADHLRPEIASGRVELMAEAVNGGFGWANNQALLSIMRRPNVPEFFWLINPDCLPEGNAGTLLKAELRAHPGCAAAGSQLVNLNGSVSGSAFRFPSVGREFVASSGVSLLGRLLGIAPTLVPLGQAGEVDWVTGASCMLRTSALQAIGLFDDGFFLYFEEVELMFRLRARGWTVRHVPSSRVKHIGGVSTGIKNGKAIDARALPTYWYNSRRRFFSLCYGRLGALLANIAWLAGRPINFVVRNMALGRSDDSGMSIRQLLRVGIGPRFVDSIRSIPRFDDPPGSPPLWLKNLPS